MNLTKQIRQVLSGLTLACAILTLLLHMILPTSIHNPTPRQLLLYNLGTGGVKLLLVVGCVLALILVIDAFSNKASRREDYTAGAVLFIPGILSTATFFVLSISFQYFLIRDMLGTFEVLLTVSSLASAVFLILGAIVFLVKVNKEPDAAYTPQQGTVQAADSGAPVSAETGGAPVSAGTSGVACPNCGSHDLQLVSDVQGKGASFWKLCFCGLLGLCGAGKTTTTHYWICRHCGNKFKA